MENCEYFFSGYKNKPFSYKTASKCPTILGEIKMNEKYITKNKVVIFEIKIASELPKDCQKMIADVMLLIDKFPNSNLSEIIETCSEKKIEEKMEMDEIYIIFLEIGDFLCFSEFTEYGAKGMAKIWSQVKSPEWFHDSIQIKNKKPTEPNKWLHLIPDRR